MYLVINNCVTAVKVSNFCGHYLRNRSTLDIGCKGRSGRPLLPLHYIMYTTGMLQLKKNLDIGVLGYIGIVQHKEHSPEVLSIPPGTPCIYIYIQSYSK